MSGENSCPESCVNTLGSYSCPCALGMTMVDGKCVEAKECDKGYVLFDGKCLGMFFNLILWAPIIICYLPKGFKLNRKNQKNFPGL